MRAREVAVDLQPWSRRFRAYTEMIKSGSPNEVAKVLRDMYRLKFDKDLSFGERRLLDQAKSLLMKELAVAMKMTEVERAVIEAALKETRGNRRRAADLLGIGERTLYRKIKEYRLPELEYLLD
jgi:CarD family transcriptional regulator